MSPKEQHNRQRRAYQVCEPCRSRKVRCRAGNPDQPQFPCLRCERMGLRCHLVKSKRRNTSNQSEYRGDPKLDTLPERPWTESPSVESSAKPYLFLEDEVHDSNDAFNALVKASTCPSSKSDNMNEERDDSELHSIAPSRMSSAVGAPPSLCPRPDYAVWKKFWLVKNHWLRPEDAAWYVESFFANMVPITPILSGFFADPDNHEFLITNEPLLCYTILTISTAYNTIPTSSLSPSSDMLHVKCWQITKDLCQRVFWAAERGSNSRLRTLGTVLAMLLLTEWPPRMISLPPEDAVDYIHTDEPASPCPRNGDRIPTFEDADRHIRLANASRWMAELTQPIIRADRMSGMLLGMAETLAEELNIDRCVLPQIISKQRLSSKRDRLQQRYWECRARVRLLLYARKAQHCMRFGTRNHGIGDVEEAIALTEELSQRAPGPESEWLSTLAAWARLAQISDDTRGLLTGTDSSPSPAQGEESSVRIKHLASIMDCWVDRTNNKSLPSPGKEILQIEYNFLRARLHCEFVDTISKRLLPKLSSVSSLEDYIGIANLHLRLDPYTRGDENWIKEMLAASRALISLIVQLGEQGCLQYTPLRVYTRAIFAATALVKGVCIYPRKDELSAALMTVDRARKCILDCFFHDALHPARGIATALSLHQRQLSMLLALSSKQHQPPGPVEADLMAFERRPDSASRAMESEQPMIYDTTYNSQQQSGTDPDATYLDEQMPLLLDDWCYADINFMPLGGFTTGPFADSVQWMEDNLDTF